jgi:hypothetical protein
MEIVKASVRHLAELQTQIKSFMDFLGDISTIVDHTVDHSNLVYGAAEDTDNVMNPDVKEVRTFHTYWARSNIYTGLA